MTLELTEQQRADLKDVLDSALERLLGEIAAADHRAYRKALSERYDRLEELRRRLEHAEAGADAHL